MLRRRVERSMLGTSVLERSRLLRYVQEVNGRKAMRRGSWFDTEAQGRKSRAEASDDAMRVGGLRPQQTPGTAVYEHVQWSPAVAHAAGKQERVSRLLSGPSPRAEARRER